MVSGLELTGVETPLVCPSVSQLPPAGLVTEAAATLEELVPAVYDDVSPRLYPVAARSLSAHLEKLAAERRALEQSGRWQLQG